MPERRQTPRTATRVMSILMVLIGLAIFVRTVLAGGGPLSRGIVLGLLFVAAGGGRLYLQSRE